MKCESCGQEMPPNASLCPTCGWLAPQTNAAPTNVERFDAAGAKTLAENTKSRRLYRIHSIVLAAVLIFAPRLLNEQLSKWFPESLGAITHWFFIAAIVTVVSTFLILAPIKTKGTWPAFLACLITLGVVAYGGYEIGMHYTDFAGTQGVKGVGWAGTLALFVPADGVAWLITSVVSSIVSAIIDPKTS